MMENLFQILNRSQRITVICTMLNVVDHEQRLLEIRILCVSVS